MSSRGWRADASSVTCQGRAKIYICNDFELGFERDSLHTNGSSLDLSQQPLSMSTGRPFGAHFQQRRGPQETMLNDPTQSRGIIGLGDGFFFQTCMFLLTLTLRTRTSFRQQTEATVPTIADGSTSRYPQAQESKSKHRQWT